MAIYNDKTLLSAYITNHFDVIDQYNVSEPADADVFLLGVSHTLKNGIYSDAAITFTKLLCQGPQDKNNVIFVEGIASWKPASIPLAARCYGWDSPKLAEIEHIFQAATTFEEKNALVEQLQLERTAAMVNTLAKLNFLKALAHTQPHIPFPFHRTFIPAGAGHYKELPSDINNPNFSLNTLRTELKNHKAVILFPKGLLQDFYQDNQTNMATKA